MKLRNFLKTLGVSSVAGLFIKPSINTEAAATLPKFQLVDKPLDPKKDYVYEDENWRIFAFVTANVLIPCKDEKGEVYWETNCYGEYWMCCATVTLKGKSSEDTYNLRFESPKFLKEDLDNVFDNFIEKIRVEAKARFKLAGLPIDTYPNKIVFETC